MRLDPKTAPDVTMPSDPVSAVTTCLRSVYNVPVFAGFRCTKARLPGRLGKCDIVCRSYGNPQAGKSMQTNFSSVVSSVICPLLSLLMSAGSVAAVEIPSAMPGVDKKIAASLPGWLDLYKTCHENPELSSHEKQSAARLAGLFRDAGYEVTENIGGYGVVGVMKNGNGPTVLIRGDMDALPITEETGLPFASKVKVELGDGSHVGVMHACGHDMHQTVLAATAQTLAAMKDKWKGTVLLVAQPAEEIGQGARLMIEDGLFKRFPMPDKCIALHVSHELATGAIGYTSGWVWANVDSVDITVHGKGGHGAYPHASIDPIVTACQIVSALQTIISRRVNPLDQAVITVGSIHAGTKHNIIPATAVMQITVRTFTDEVRKEVLDSIKRIAINTARAMGCPKDPDVVVLDKDFTPAAYNDPDLTAHAVNLFEKLIGKDNVHERPPSMGGEDFGLFAKTAGVPGFMFVLGVVDEARFEASKKPGGEALPTVHSSKFRTEPEPTLRTGVRCMTGLALSLLNGQ